MDDRRAVGEDALERREDLGEDVGADDQDRVRLRGDPAAVLAEHVAELAAEERVRGAMFTSEEFAPHTSAPSSSATRASSACAPECATPSPMMIERPLGAGEQVGARLTASSVGRTRVSGNEVGTTGSSSGASSTSIGRSTKTGPIGGVAAILIARRSTRSSEPGSTTRVDPLRHRLGHRDQVGRHLRVHRVVADARLAGDDDQRRVAALGLVHHADAVAEADAPVQLHERRPARRAGVAVGHRRRRSSPGAP